MTNRLANSTSPYLLQHANNPVDWYEWGEEAFAEARCTGKPIFLSIGYSTCHWCHVMAHECFENAEIAKIQNEVCINIKVDREERPDIDEIYMSATQLLTGQGGWPMNIFLDHDLKPFFAGTYFPPTPRYGRISFPMLLQRIGEVWQNKRAELQAQSERIIGDMHLMTGLNSSAASLPAQDWVLTAVNRLKNGYDPVDGGFSGAPKFPDSQGLLLLLKHSLLTKDSEAQVMANFTLQKMAMGGIYDSLGGGFARYSVDEKWFAPHFEKMLYDNAMLPRAYQTAALIALKDNEELTQEFTRVAAETCEVILREFTDASAGFHSAQDADSEGVEGKFYVWSFEELVEVLGAGDADLFADVFNCSRNGEGNWEEGNILFLTQTWSEWFKLKPELLQKWPQWREKLYLKRKSRIHPSQDDKVLSEWNGMMIATLAFVGSVQQRIDFIKAAEGAAHMIWREMWVPSYQTLLRCFRAGGAHTPGFSADYANVADGFLALWEATGELDWLLKAQNIVDSLIAQFWDQETGAFYYTPVNQQHLLVRSKHPFDNPYPSPNTVAVRALQKLYRWTGKNEYLEKYEKTLLAYSTLVEKQTWGLAGMIGELQEYYAAQTEVVLLYPQQSAVDSMLAKSAREVMLPGKIVVAISAAQAMAQDKKGAWQHLPILQEKIKLWLSDGAQKEVAYVCQNQTCSLPIYEWSDLKDRLNSTL